MLARLILGIYHAEVRERLALGLSAEDARWFARAHLHLLVRDARRDYI